MDDRVAILIDLLEALALIVDKDFVDNFITPQIEALMEGESTKMKIGSIRPGQVAPMFTLTTITGAEVSLNEVLSENELVLVVFLGFLVSLVYSWFSRIQTDVLEEQRPRVRNRHGLYR